MIEIARRERVRTELTGIRQSNVYGKAGTAWEMGLKFLSFATQADRIKSDFLCNAPHRLGRLKSRIGWFGFTLSDLSIGLLIEPVVELIGLQVAPAG